jgi:hypothetical protein
MSAGADRSFRGQKQGQVRVAGGLEPGAFEAILRARLAVLLLSERQIKSGREKAQKHTIKYSMTQSIAKLRKKEKNL